MKEWYVTVIHYIHDRNSQGLTISTHVRESNIAITKASSGEYRCQSSQLDRKLFDTLKLGKWHQVKLAAYPQTEAEREKCVAIANKSLNKPVKWDMRNNNCEHFINAVLTGKPLSLQVEKEKARLVAGLFTGAVAVASTITLAKGILIASAPAVIVGGLMLNGIPIGSVFADLVKSGRRHLSREPAFPDCGSNFMEAIELTELSSSLESHHFSSSANTIV